MMRVLVIGGTGSSPYVPESSATEHEDSLPPGRSRNSLAPGARHFKSEKAAMPVVTFRKTARRRVRDRIHRIAMGERDARAVVRALTGRDQRLVVLSGGDVYRAMDDSPGSSLARSKRAC